MSFLEKLKLPPHLLERCRSWKDNGPVDHALQPRLVVYWMCSAQRVEENPALDVALAAAQQLDLPLLVYQGLSEKYEYASDRHHTFILQSACDVQQALARRGIPYAFYLERQGYRQPALSQLLRQTEVLITEDMPTGAQPRFLRALSRTNEVPAVLVDTACVVPMQLIGKAYERAFQFREAHQGFVAPRVSRAWKEVPFVPRELDRGQLPFQPLDLALEDIADLVSQCEIDHSIGPVVDTHGGSQAGYDRWEAFRDQRLQQYSRTRNDPNADGVSRMSAYLHHGMVSPLRLARETAAVGGPGAEKYLDELLVWRELAYCFCRFRKNFSGWQAIPEWARKTLDQHASDPRETIYSWEQLARGQTGNRLWDAAQRSLLIHGELHNNVRMTWGKALLQWTASPMQALQTLVELNHRYALDGRDPSSYGGILWCLGQFDRPFAPEQPVIGTVRPRPLAQHAARLDVDRYYQRSSLSRCSHLPRVAVIGAGLAGSIAARTVADHGIPITLYEKSRGAGGRMATRTVDALQFDHGAQYFTVRDKRFRRYVGSWRDQGIVQEWSGEVATFEGLQDSTSRKSSTDRFVSIPKMNSICRHITQELPLQTQVSIASVQTIQTDVGKQYVLTDSDDQQHGPFDRVIVTAPAPQSAVILSEFADLSRDIAESSMQPCWAVMLGLKTSLTVDWNAAFVNGLPISWIARNGTKPGRPQRVSEALTVHASQAWSAEHIEDPPEVVIEALSDIAIKLLSLEAEDIVFSKAHRWRYALPTQPGCQRFFASDDGNVLAGGDWAGGPRVEGAFLSGMAMAGRILGSLS